MQLQPSSIAPLQLSSIPLPQISAPGLLGVQVEALPAVQAATVTWHAPRPQVVVPSAEGSSTVPLQSSSTPLQTSADGRTWPMQGPSTPLTHWEVPARQAPPPRVALGPV